MFDKEDTYDGVDTTPIKFDALALKRVELTCTRCLKLKERYDEIVYSQGSRVCLPCNELTREADNVAFDRDMEMRR